MSPPVVHCLAPVICAFSEDRPRGTCQLLATRGGVYDTMIREGRVARLRTRLERTKEARVPEVEAYLRASGWTRRQTKGGHRGGGKEGRRTLGVPVHGAPGKG